MRSFMKLFLIAGVVSILITPLIALAGIVDPQCTDGECSEFVQDCWNAGREVVCINEGTDGAVTLCLPWNAAATLFEHHPNVCRGSCDYPLVCNDFDSSIPDSEPSE